MEEGFVPHLSGSGKILMIVMADSILTEDGRLGRD